MKIIINADDFGLTHTKNIAIDNMMREGICTNASLVVNSVHTEEAVRMAIEGGYNKKISLHLNLTEGESLTAHIRGKKLYCQGAKFVHRPIIKHTKQILPVYIRSLRAELEAQILRFMDYGFELRSIDSHNWVHLRWPVWLALRPLIKKYGIKAVRPMWIGYRKPEIASVKWSRYFRMVEPILLACRQCRVVQYTSNIEQFLLAAENLEKCSVAEVFTHPDLIEGEIIDTSSSYLRNPQNTVKANVYLTKEHEHVTIEKILTEVYDL